MAVTAGLRCLGLRQAIAWSVQIPASPVGASVAYACTTSIRNRLGNTMAKSSIRTKSATPLLEPSCERSLHQAAFLLK